MKLKSLSLSLAVAAAVSQAVSAIPLATVNSGTVSSEVRHKLLPGPGPVLSVSDADLLAGSNIGGATSASGVGLAGNSQAATEWSFFSDEDSAVFQVNSFLRLHDVSLDVQNRSDIFLTVSEDAIFSVDGGLFWNPNDFYVEALDQFAALRQVGDPYTYLEQDFRRSNFDPANNSLTFNNLNESPSVNGELVPNEPGYNVTPRIEPASYLLSAGVYQLRWNNRITEGGMKGLGSPDDSDFVGVGQFRFTLEALQENRVPETSTTIMLLGAGMIGLAVAGRRLGTQNA